MSEERHINTEGYILKTANAGDFARSFTFISPTLGIANSIAFGAERLKSRFCSTIQPFVKAKLFLYLQPKNNQYKIEDISDIEPNDFIRNSINTINLSYFFVDILTNSYLQRDEYKSYYYLLSYSLEILKEKGDLKKSFLFFVVKYLLLSGYSFDLVSCIGCGRQSPNYYFDVANGGVACPECAKFKKYPITQMESSLLKNFFDKRYLLLKEFLVSQVEISNIVNILLYALEKIFDKKLKTFELINESLFC